MPFSSLTNAEIAHGMWAFTGGAILVLLQSILSGTKRNWWSLLIGCVLGGAGAYVAGTIWADSKYVYIICGVAAVVTENLLGGVVNASKQFAESPIKVGSAVLKTFVPMFGKSAGDSGVGTDGLK
jgi:hypothetical protein